MGTETDQCCALNLLTKMAQPITLTWPDAPTYMLQHRRVNVCDNLKGYENLSGHS